jgi:hypothetical protein
MEPRITAVPQGGAGDPARRAWARKVLANLGLGMARDESGFFRPAKVAAQRQRPEPEDDEDPLLPVARRRRCAKVRTTGLQLSLFP